MGTGRDSRATSQKTQHSSGLGEVARGGPAWLAAAAGQPLGAGFPFLALGRVPGMVIRLGEVKGKGAERGEPVSMPPPHHLPDQHSRWKRPLQLEHRGRQTWSRVLLPVHDGQGT